ncbi:MAG: hypothetical protein LPJ89_03650 [Hymenobacteraceae bacterium]|nr:hypothetical protein [Hymenobacteraceae bacterium]MDX5397188.1 hypothetical protein [Hymenobacteraceae bacterium]MDX5442858.1 hypothetical protein [Hymenobacteraceae bacterium]MDX5513264.1 hypothetical protein [Hymenobacteraceae bacterium]
MKELFGRYSYDFNANYEETTITKIPGVNLLRPILICIAIFIGWSIGTYRVEAEFAADNHIEPSEGFWYYMGFVFDFFSYLPLIVIGLYILATAYFVWKELRWKVVLTNSFIKFRTDNASGKWSMEEIAKLECVNEPGNTEGEAAAYRFYLINRNGRRVNLFTFYDKDETEYDALTDMKKVSDEFKKLVGVKDKPEVH